MIKKAICPVLALLGFASAADAKSSDGIQASFEGQTIDLAVGWAGATACLEIGGEVTCYRTERQMLDALVARSTPSELLAGVGASAVATCSSSLRLYDGTGFTGAVVAFTTRQTGLNLSSYGFDNRTSSYRVGGCSGSLYSSANLGGSVLSVGANTTASSMPAGWDNVVSSLWIN